MLHLTHTPPTNWQYCPNSKQHYEHSPLLSLIVLHKLALGTHWPLTKQYLLVSTALQSSLHCNAWLGVHNIELAYSKLQATHLLVVALQQQPVVQLLTLHLIVTLLKVQQDRQPIEPPQMVLLQLQQLPFINAYPTVQLVQSVAVQLLQLLLHTVHELFASLQPIVHCVHRVGDVQVLQPLLQGIHNAQFVLVAGRQYDGAQVTQNVLSMHVLQLISHNMHMPLRMQQLLSHTTHTPFVFTLLQPIINRHCPYTWCTQGMDGHDAHTNYVYFTLLQHEVQPTFTIPLVLFTILLLLLDVGHAIQLVYVESYVYPTMQLSQPYNDEHMQFCLQGAQCCPLKYWELPHIWHTLYATNMENRIKILGRDCFGIQQFILQCIQFQLLPYIFSNFYRIRTLIYILRLMRFLEDHRESTAHYYPALPTLNIQARSQFSSPVLLRSLSSPRSFVSLPIANYQNGLQALKSSNIMQPFNSCQYKSDAYVSPKKFNTNRLYFKKLAKCQQQISPRRISPTRNIKIINYGPIQVCCAKLTSNEKPTIKKVKKHSPQKNKEMQEITSKAQKQNIEQIVKSPPKIALPQTRYYDKNQQNSTMSIQTTTTFTNASLYNQTINITVNKTQNQKNTKGVLSASSKFIHLIQQNQVRSDKKGKKIKSVRIIQEGDVKKYNYLYVIGVLCIGIIMILLFTY